MQLKKHAALRRRPLLTPVWLSAFGAILFAVALSWAWHHVAMTTVFVIRHAEKVASGTQDPALSAAGEAHAARYAALFGTAVRGQHLQAVYATEFRRTQQTAAVVARRLGIPLHVIPAADTAELVEHLLRHYRGQRVLVVGHSNTVPALISALGGDTVPALGEADYSRLYVVSVGLFSRTTVTELALP